MVNPSQARGPLAHAQIVSVVTVLDRSSEATIAESLPRLHAAVAGIKAPFEIVVVINGCARSVTDSMRRLTDELSNLQFYTLQYPVDRATALVAGIENAVGDWIATFDLGADAPEIVGTLFAAVMREGTDVGLALPRQRGTHRSPLDRTASTLFHRLFRAIHGFSLAEATPSVRLLSRAVVNAMLQHDSPLVAFETLTATSGYRETRIVAETRGAETRGAAGPLRDRIRTRWRTLIGMNAVPLRLANALCGLGAVTAVIYSLYVILIYIFKPDVMPGWTTVSLMISCMFLMISLVLGLMSEYMIMLLDTAGRRPRYETADEFASNEQARRRFLNVETETWQQPL